MPDFDFRRLRRFPDVEAPNLQAWAATDELLVAHALRAQVPGEQIAVIGDGFGAISLALTDAGLRGIRVHQDLVTGRRALAANAAELGLPLPVEHELDDSLLDGARLVLLQLPRELRALHEIADAIARWAEPDAVLVAGGRVKHMTLAQNDVLAEFFTEVQPQRAARKSRLIVASRPDPAVAERPLPEPETAAHVVSRTADPASPLEFVIRAYGGAFAGARLDIGARTLIEAMPALSRTALLEKYPSAADSIPTRTDPRHPSRAESGPGRAEPDPDPREPDPDPREPRQGLRVVDLGCGTGALAVAFALQHPDAVVRATDRSAAAVRSAQATVVANGLAGRIAITLDDAGSQLPDAGADLVLLNPPFHLGASVHEGAGRRLIQAAARLTRPGGEVWTVFNSHLDHRRALTGEVGPTEQIARTAKFTVTRSIRRD